MIDITTRGQFPGTTVGITTAGKFRGSWFVRIIMPLYRFISKPFKYFFVSKDALGR